MITAEYTRPHRSTLAGTLGDEGFRLFFPLAALHVAVWPFLWVVVHGLDLPFARTIPPGIWHAHEMIVGGFGAALLGFITTAVPEWTDTPRLRGAPLFRLAALWSIARLIGLFGADALMPIAALADMAWLAYLILYVAGVSMRKRTTRLSGFLFWMTALFLAEAATRAFLYIGEIDLGQRSVHLAGYVFLGLLGLALARITVPVTNLILDPSETTSPFRPHPGRLNLAPGLVAIMIAGEIAGLSSAVTGYLMIAAGAAFLDRVAEAFVGREAVRSELAVLAGSSALAGTGLLLTGAARLGAPFSEVTGLHSAFMGGLGLGVLGVLSIAGLLHTGRPLRFAPATRIALSLCVAGTVLRVVPELGFMTELAGPHYAIASTVWAASFLLWLKTYWPALSDPTTIGQQTC